MVSQDEILSNILDHFNTHPVSVKTIITNIQLVNLRLIEKSEEKELFNMIHCDIRKAKENQTSEASISISFRVTKLHYKWHLREEMISSQFQSGFCRRCIRVYCTSVVSFNPVFRLAISLSIAVITTTALADAYLYFFLICDLECICIHNCKLLKSRLPRQALF